MTKYSDEVGFLVEKLRSNYENLDTNELIALENLESAQELLEEDDQEGMG